MENPYIGCDFEHFPHSTAFSEGIQVLQAHVDEISCRTLCNVVYRVVDDKPLHLHIILPTLRHDESRRFPAVLYVQGSGWLKQSHGRELVQLARFAQKGYVIAILQYRHSEWAPFPAQIIDAKYGIQFLMEHAEEYFIDSDKLILWGDSSGGHTALMAGLTRGLPEFTETGLTEYPARCWVDFYAPVNIAELYLEPTAHAHRSVDCPEGLFLGRRVATPENAAPTVLTNYIAPEKDIPPIIIFHGSKDRKIPFGQSVRLYNTLKTAGKEVECYQVYNADHGDDPFWNHEILDLIDRFVQKCL